MRPSRVLSLMSERTFVFTFTLRCDHCKHESNAANAVRALGGAGVPLSEYCVGFLGKRVSRKGRTYQNDSSISDFDSLLSSK